jgi:hypothetical protein
MGMKSGGIPAGCLAVTARTLYTGTASPGSLSFLRSVAAAGADTMTGQGKGYSPENKKGRLSMRFLKLSALMAVMLFCAVMMLGVLSLGGLPVRGGSGGAPGATVSGDVNCDGKVDVSDAIYTLQFLFAHGPAPCALAQDNFATKDDLNALSARVAAMEASAKGFGNIAAGRYIGDGQTSRTIETGLPGQILYVRVFRRYVQNIASRNDYRTWAVRIDKMADKVMETENGASLDFSANNFIVYPGKTSGEGLNEKDVEFTWVAFSTSA